ncbi:MAG: hydroxyacylglutathione hydrolase C-terminal domain-containing protein, partial [Kingella oralis]
LYPAHEYTAANLRFAAHIEPDNPHILAAQQRAQTIPSLPVTLAHEKQINPFLRVHLPAVQQRIRQLTQQTYDSDEDYFVALRELKNRF